MTNISKEPVVIEISSEYASTRVEIEPNGDGSYELHHTDMEGVCWYSMVAHATLDATLAWLAGIVNTTMAENFEPERTGRED